MPDVRSNTPEAPETKPRRERVSVRNKRRRWLVAASAALGGIISVVTSLLVNLAAENLPREPRSDWRVTLSGLVVVVVVASAYLIERLGRMATKSGELSTETFKVAAERAVAAIEETLPATEPSLEEEIGEVSSSLSATVSRLREISDKAEAFEAEVQELVARADAAKAAAELHEEDARKIAVLLGSETEKRFRLEIAKLTEEHNLQIERLRKSGNRMAIATFIGGVVLGMIGNVAVAVFMG